MLLERRGAAAVRPSDDPRFFLNTSDSVAARCCSSGSIVHFASMHLKSTKEIRCMRSNETRSSGQLRSSVVMTKGRVPRSTTHQAVKVSQDAQRHRHN